MESYKHSCPFCGQHIEYTVGYCGKQMQCPICGQTITFPALPPGGQHGTTLRVKSLEHKQEKKWRLPPTLVFLLNFKHWNVVAQCAVPFLVIGGLLVGAAFVKKKLSDESAPVAPPVVQADPDAWQKMTDLAKADQAVKDRMKELEAAHARAEMAQRLRKQVEHLDAFQRKSTEQQAEAAQRELLVAKQRFDLANDSYRQLGGTVDYRAQVKDY
jgi:hypothetical protein